jgi:hypothetical protein
MIELNLNPSSMKNPTSYFQVALSKKLLKQNGQKGVEAISMSSSYNQRLK